MVCSPVSCAALRVVVNPPAFGENSELLTNLRRSDAFYEVFGNRASEHLPVRIRLVMYRRASFQPFSSSTSILRTLDSSELTRSPRLAQVTRCRRCQFEPDPDFQDDQCFVAESESGMTE